MTSSFFMYTFCISYRHRKPIRQLNSTIELKNSYVYIIGDVFARRRMTKLSVSVYSWVPPLATDGKPRAKPAASHQWPGESEIIHRRLSLVIGHQANMCRIIYTYEFFSSIVEFNCRIGLRRLYEIQNLYIKNEEVICLYTLLLFLSLLCNEL